MDAITPPSEYADKTRAYNTVYVIGSGMLPALVLIRREII